MRLPTLGLAHDSPHETLYFSEAVRSAQLEWLRCHGHQICQGESLTDRTTARGASVLRRAACDSTAEVNRHQRERHARVRERGRRQGGVRRVRTAVAYRTTAVGRAGRARAVTTCTLSRRVQASRTRRRDAAAPACASFGFSAAAGGGGGGLCRLRSAAGEPKKFCKRGDWVSYWRVDLRDADDDDDGLDGWLDVDVGPSGGARRALVRGRQLIDSATGAALHLHGVNIYVDYMRFDDMGLLSHLLPQANLVRLVGVFWHDDDACACCTDDAARGCDAASLASTRRPRSCHSLHRPTHRALTPQVLCAVVPRRAPRRRAHGDRPRRLGDRRREGEDRRRRPLGERRARRLLRRKSRAQVPRALGVPRARAARRAVRRRRRGDARAAEQGVTPDLTPRIPHIQVMSEPRNKAVAQETVARFYEGVCAAVHRVDNRMPCVVGPTPYYKVWQLNGSMILRDGDGSPMKGIVYTFDFYDPWDFVTSDAEDGYSYPDECAALCLTHSTRAKSSPSPPLIPPYLTPTAGTRARSPSAGGFRSSARAAAPKSSASTAAGSATCSTPTRSH